MRLRRRAFLQLSGFALLAGGRASAQRMGPFLPPPAPVPGQGKKVLVVLFLRGGADGLSMVPPVGDPDYPALRPTLALARPGAGSEAALRLDDTFGLHPALAPLAPLYAQGSLAFIHAVGSPRPTRSHFDAQDFLEAGTPGQRAHDGWLNRALGALPATAPSAFRAVALGPTLPRSLWGEAPAVSFGSLAEFRLRGGARRLAAGQTFEALYASAVDEALRATGVDAFEALRALDEARLFNRPPEHGARYPASPLGRRLQDVARLIKADVGVQLAATDAGGWDTHLAQGAAKGPLATRLEDLAEAVAAFAADLGPRLDDVCLVTLTEFGRTAKENGNRGTDHGTGSVISVLGGAVRGGRVLGRWPGLARAQLFEERDLAVTTDFRAVLAEVVQRHLSLESTAEIFPGFTGDPPGLFG